MSIIHAAIVDGSFFKVHDDGNHDDVFLPSWQWWLKTHRAIEQNRRLAPAHRIDLSGPDWQLKDRVTKLRALGLEPQQIQNLPIHLFTLSIAAFDQEQEVRSFLQRSWLLHRLPQRQIYRTVPKCLRLFAGGEFTTKSDPLYSWQEVTPGKKKIHLCYGVYASATDASKDGRLLTRCWNRAPEVRQTVPTTALIRRVWIEAVTGEPDSFAPWEAER
jgi:hypothetical protein